MQLESHTLCARVWWAFALCAGLSAACSEPEERIVKVPPAADAGEEEPNKPDDSVLTRGCVDVEVEGDQVVEHLQDFTVRYQLGTAYARTVMLFGGEPVEEPNTPSRAYIFGLDKVDAQRMAKKYPDFYLCSSVGGEEAASYIEVYDMVPATCQIHQQLAGALRLYAANALKGGDRTSLHIEGAPLTLLSVIDERNGADVKDQVKSQMFHLITSVQRLTGQSLVSFGTSD